MGAMKISLGSQYEKTGSRSAKREREFTHVSAQIFADLLSAKTKEERLRKSRKRSEPSAPWSERGDGKELSTEVVVS